MTTISPPIPKPRPTARKRRSLWWGLSRLIAGQPYERRLVRYRLGELAARWIGGCWLPEDQKIWLMDESFMSDYRRFSSNLRSAERKFAVRELVRSLDGVEGDTVECGAYLGATSYFICQQRGRGPHHVFDSFAGLSEPRAEDAPDDTRATPWQSGDLPASEAKCRQNLAEFPWVEFHPGWIPDRFPEVAGRRFSFVHIDVDLYQPTLDSLQFFYPRMTPRGIIVCDDYGYANCPGAKAACDEFCRTIPEPMIHLPTGQGVLFKA